MKNLHLWIGLCLLGAALAGQPPRDPVLLAQAHLRVLNESELFKQSKTEFSKLRVADLLAAYPKLEGFQPPLADVAPNTPLRNVAFLASYDHVGGLLNPHTPMPRKGSSADKVLTHLARSLLESSELTKGSISWYALFKKAKRWFLNDALIENSPHVLFKIKVAGKGCVGYMAIRSWQQPGSRRVVLYPCIRDDFVLSEGSFKRLVTPLGIKPQGRSYSVTLPLTDSSWPPSDDCPSAALDVRKAVVTDGKYLVTAGTGNVYEVFDGFPSLLNLSCYAHPALEYRKDAGFNNFTPPRLTIAARFILKRISCTPLPTR